MKAAHASNSNRLSNWQIAQGITARALANGTHSENAKRLCTKCYQWVDQIVYAPPGTHDRLCPACAPFAAPPAPAPAPAPAAVIQKDPQ